MSRPDRNRRGAPHRAPQAPPPTARRVALDALRRIDQDGAYANLVLDHALGASGLDRRDRGFVTDLVSGTTRMQRACDALVDRFVLTDPEPEVRRILRLGAYQLVFAGVPAHAAVAETVALAPARARGFVNAVLRKVAATPMVWPDDATRLSYPEWLAALLHDEVGDEAAAVMERMNVAPPVSSRDDGYTQDRASQWVVAAVEAQPGERVLDLCAAPGGKATGLANAGAHVVAVDRSANRVQLLAGNVERLDADVSVVHADGISTPFPDGSFDRVLLDAPCSGIGALRRRPDARWRLRPTDIVDLAALQRALLHDAARLVRPGGVLVYSVCTITRAESVEHPVPASFDPIDGPLPRGNWRPFEHGWRVLPHDDDTDGMVVVRYRRRT
jgi:16S rRNA (cytosine967-C5)-methyltransferase